MIISAAKNTSFLFARQFVREVTMEGLKGKVAIVTGGATMIGAHGVRAFHKQGTRVVIGDIDAHGGQAVADEFAGSVLFVKTDLGDDQQIAACVEQTVATFGGVDFLVNVACNYVDGGIGASRRDWLDSFNINVVGGGVMLKGVRPPMIRRGGGTGVNFRRITAEGAQRRRRLASAKQAAVPAVSP